MAARTADAKGARDVVILEVGDVLVVADEFVIASAPNDRQVRAIVDEITDKLRDEHHLRPKSVDGTLRTAWVVLDYFDVIVHVMRGDIRDRYDLETLWGDAPRVKTRKRSAAKA